MCNKVWQPEFGVLYNADADIRGQYNGTDPVPVKHRPDSDTDDEDTPMDEPMDEDAPKADAPPKPDEQPLPGMRTLQQHTGADFEAGRVGQRNGEAPPDGVESEDEDVPVIPLRKQAAATV